MAVGNLFGRALSYVLNELVVEGLVNSCTFQRFAVRTSKALEDMSEKVKDELVEQMKDELDNFNSKRQ